MVVLAMLAITSLQIVLAIKSSLVRSDEIHKQKRHSDVRKRGHRSLLAVQHTMTTEVLPDARVVGMGTMSATQEANTRQHLEEKLFAKNKPFMLNRGQAQEAVAALKVLAVKTPVDGLKKTHMIRRQHRHPINKKYAITSDAGNIEFTDMTLGTYAEPGNPIVALPEQTPVPAQTVAPTAPITLATAAPVLPGTIAPTGPTTPAPVTPVTADGSGSWLGSVIVNLFIFALAVVIITIVCTICYGGVFEFLRLRTQTMDRLNPRSANDEEHETFRSIATYKSRHKTTRASTLSNKLTLPDLSAMKTTGNMSEDVEESAGSYKTRHKSSRSSTLLNLPDPSAKKVTYGSEEGESSAGGAASYKSPHKSGRRSRASTLNLPEHSARKLAMEDIEEHEF